MRGPAPVAKRALRGLLFALACLALGALGHVSAGGELPGAVPLALVLVLLTAGGTALLDGRRPRFTAATVTLGATQFALHLAFHHLAAGSGHAGHSAPAGDRAGGHGAGGPALSGPAATGHGTGGPGTGGQGMSGHAMDGHAMSGHSMGGHSMSGHAMDGSATGGHSLSGHGMGGSGAGPADGPVSGSGAEAHAMAAMTGMTLAHALATLASVACVLYGERLLRRLAALVLARLLRLVVPPLPALPPRAHRRFPAPRGIRFGVLLARSCPRRGPPPAALA
ncbi:hypothetical protein ABZ929_03455 [Streptomyces physcomitrii]|uniref:hypothetical protein n=1 Tax=Streptomyces physcomitrii TaxID=2724184 RepID=UPI0033DE8A43